MDERSIHRWFLVSVWLKGVDAAVECAGGLVLLLVPVEGLTQLAQAVTRTELIEDPHDLLANLLRNWASSLSVSTAHFYAAYLLVHGVVKIALVFGLLRNRIWAYPASLVVLCAFIVYQIYRLAHGFILGLALLTAFDVVVIALVWHEYRIMRRNGAGIVGRD